MSGIELVPLKYLTKAVNFSMSVLFFCDTHLNTAVSSSTVSSARTLSKFTSSAVVGDVTVGVSGDEVGGSCEGRRNT